MEGENKAGQHQCPVKGCTVICPRHMLMCRQHWYMVPPRLRDAVNAEWRKGISETYWDVRQQAILIVNGKVSKDATSET